MKKKITLEFTEEEMRRLAEMSATMLSLMLLDTADEDAQNLSDWRWLTAKLLNAAHKVPDIALDMEIHPELGHWYFSQDYVEDAFYSKLLNEVRDTVFWEELVMRMAEHTMETTIPATKLKRMSENEQSASLASLEQALWHEVTNHGLDRLMFVVPETEH